MDELDAFGRALRARVQMRGILAVLAATLLLLPAAAARPRRVDAGLREPLGLRQ